MSDEQDELSRAAAALREIMNKPFTPRRAERKPKKDSTKQMTELNGSDQDDHMRDQ